jgi:hypothetical protein
MRKDLLRRLKQLERQSDPPQRVQWIWVTHPLDATRKAFLAKNERIVCDIYAWDHGAAYGRHRVTTDPADEGRSCPPGTYLEDVVRELNLEDRYLASSPDRGS